MKLLKVKILRILMAIFILGAVMALTGCSSAPDQGKETTASQESESETETTAATDPSTSEAEPDPEVKANENETVETPAPLTFETVNEVVYATANVNIRTSYTTNSAKLGLLSKGQPITRTGRNDQWSRVVFQEKECYIATAYLTLEEPVKATAPAQAAGTGNTYGSGDRIVAIDPGHQRKGNSEKEPIGPGASTTKAKVTGGATGVSTGLPEYELNLQVSLKLKQELLNRGYQVVMIRESNDVNLSNSERAAIANQSGAGAFIRIHGNSIGDSSVHGALTMGPTANNPYISHLYDASYSLNKNIIDNLCAATGAKNRGVTLTDTMSGINWCQVPVSIVEMGFMSNPDEDRNMASEDYQNKIVKGIADGIDAYFAGQ